jgi:hypothetical protein
MRDRKDIEKALDRVGGHEGDNPTLLLAALLEVSLDVRDILIRIDEDTAPVPPQSFPVSIDPPKVVT